MPSDKAPGESRKEPTSAERIKDRVEVLKGQKVVKAEVNGTAVTLGFENGDEFQFDGWHL